MPGGWSGPADDEVEAIARWRMSEGAERAATMDGGRSFTRRLAAAG